MLWLIKLLKRRFKMRPVDRLAQAARIKDQIVIMECDAFAGKWRKDVEKFDAEQAKKLIDEAISLMEVAFVLHDKKLYDEVKTTKEKRRDRKLKQLEEDLDDDEMD